MASMSTEPAAVDVVVVSWNVRDDLLRCIESVLRSEAVRPRVVVVDNASSDGSADAVARRFPQVTLVRNRANLGFAPAANLGMAAGSAAMVLLLNPDTVVPPTALAALVRRLDELPRHAVVAPRLVGEDGTPQHSVHRFPSVWISLVLGTGVHRLLPRSLKARWLLEGAWGSDEEREVPWVIGAAMLVRRSAMQVVGALDERFFMYAEDLEWCDRLRRAGYGIRFLPSVTITHLGNRSGAQVWGEDRTAAYLRSTVTYLRQRHGRLWTAAFCAVNGASTTLRYAASTAMVRVRPSPRRRAMHRLWRAHARFYLKRGAAPDEPSWGGPGP